MLRKLTLVAAFGGGYVLGAKAGTQRYDQIVAKARDIAGKPAVQDLKDKATQQMSDTASHLGDAAKDKVKQAAGDAIAGVRAKVSGDDNIDLTTVSEHHLRREG